MSERGTLKPLEPHPMARDALAYVLSLGYDSLCQWLEAFSSCAIEGNRTAEICGETLRRVMSPISGNAIKVSDRYILGLAWYLREHEKEAHMVAEKELARLREIEEAAKELFFFDREHDRILDCDWPENEHPWVDDFLDALADASNEARAELERLVGEGGENV